ncbi:MAG TPA: HlyD family efflux transporter periplasmic adaptor subunit [Candidatus Dormibacteraeota bacterium]|jgi:multidrug efflux pump subunit AcrA (membrane-fusion protein)
MRERWLGNLMRRRVLVALVLVAAALGSTIVYTQASKATTTYRTAVVTYGTITQTIGMAGNLAPVSEADLNFVSSGTVQTVYVQVGQSVGVGAPLATLDSTQLSAQLQQAQATMASAQAKRSQDLAGPTAQNLTPAQNSVASAQVSVNNAQTSLTDTQAINAQSVSTAQAAVNDAQKAVDADQLLVNQDNLAVTADCLSPSTTCTNDKAKLAADEQTLARDQAALAVAKNSLAMTTAKAQQSNNQAAASLAAMQQQYAAAKSSLAALATGATWQTIQMDDAQIQINQISVNTLQHQLDSTTLAAPIAGIVAQVNVKAGQAVSTASATNAIVIFTPGAYAVTGTVSDSQVNLVALGQAADITPAGSTQAVQGKITSIAPAATISSGVATFAVTAQLTDASNSIRPGMSATVNIVLNQVVHVLTVPTSAVHTSAAGSTVQVLVNGVPKTVAVQTGASDPTRIQIVSGLQLNQVVVIAVVTSSVPSGNGSSVLGGGGRGGGSFRGGG